MASAAGRSVPCPRSLLLRPFWRPAAVAAAAPVLLLVVMLNSQFGD